MFWGHIGSVQDLFLVIHSLSGLGEHLEGQVSNPGGGSVLDKRPNLLYYHAFFLEAIIVFLWGGESTCLIIANSDLYIPKIKSWLLN